MVFYGTVRCGRAGHNKYGIELQSDGGGAANHVFSVHTHRLFSGAKQPTFKDPTHKAPFFCVNFHFEKPCVGPLIIRIDKNTHFLILNFGNVQNMERGIKLVAGVAKVMNLQKNWQNMFIALNHKFQIR